jgi:hypothetical protein
MDSTIAAKSNYQLLISAGIFGLTMAAILLILANVGEGDWVVVPIFLDSPGFIAAWVTSGGTHDGPSLWLQLFVGFPVNALVYSIVGFIAFFIRGKLRVL